MTIFNVTVEPYLLFAFLNNDLFDCYYPFKIKSFFFFLNAARGGLKLFSPSSVNRGDRPPGARANIIKNRSCI